ncbi:MAG: NAD-dependent epimerase/dehydratase family protein [Gammaproteobacteria bacterium]|nr:NAD-dependent epimerase/dehydratase family protein [Gammaproteobacteria bacterium]
MAEAKRNPGRSKKHPAPAKPVVLMTGATGFLGGAIGQALAADYTVVGLDRTPKDLAHAECVRCDFTSDESVDEALREVTSRFGTRIASVVHLAGYFDFSGEPNPLYRQVNVEGTRRLLRKLQALDVEQFIYASTMLVHAPTEPGVPISETSRVEPRWAYPQSKLETESVVAHEHGAIPSVVLRIAGVYSQMVQPPTLAHQISWIYERQFKGRVFPGETSHGQSFVHLDDLVDAVVRTVDRRGTLPPDLKLLVGEATTLSYAALQNRLGTLIHGEQWETETVPKSLAKLGARLQGKLEAVVPDAIDRGEKPFVKPFMVELADDHYELDIARAQELLGWSPRHALREELPAMVATLKADPLAWYQANRIPAPEWLETITEHPAAAHALLEKYERSVRLQHGQNLWAHFLNLGLGLWLVTSPSILGYPDWPMTLSDMASGALVMLFSLLSLSRHMAWARFANAGVGVWLLFAPLVFWAPTAAGYLNDTLVGALVTGFSLLVRPSPGVGVAARTTGPDIPPGWHYSPSTWTQRLPIIALAFVGLYISRYLAAFQLGHTDAAWDPFFGDGTERIITSEVSKAWPVPDAGLGALVYILEILTGIVGGRARWRTMPWLVVLFGVMIVPLGAVSIFFIIIQPIVIGTWCSLCLLAAAAMLLQIPYSLDELIASGQFLLDRRRRGKSVLLAFLRGDTMEGGRRIPPDDFERPARAVVRDMLGGGVNVPWTLALSTILGIWLMCSRLVFGTEGAQADSDHLLGALIVTVSITAMGEAARPVRFINILLALALMFAPFMFDGGSLVADAAGVAAGLLLVALSIPRGRIDNPYGSWSRYLV